MRRAAVAQIVAVHRCNHHIPQPERRDRLGKPRRLIFIERISYSQHNTPVEFLQAYYRADLYTLHGELKGSA